MAWSETMFYIAFVGQIYLISYHFPNRILARMAHVCATYPPETYPRLYPRPAEHYKLAMLAFRYASRLIFAIGFVILFAIVFLVDHSSFADDGFISEAWPAAYGLLQFAPLMALELSEFSHYKQMRESGVPYRRTAELRRRSLSDLVPPRLLIMACALLVAAILFDMYVHDFVVAWDRDAVQRGIVLIVTNGFLAAVGAWNIYGRKPDPHQSTSDRMQRVSVAVKSLLFVSMALSVFIALSAADDLFNLDAYDALIMTIYFQGIALLSLGYTLRNIRIDDIDFDVYRNNAVTRVTDG